MVLWARGQEDCHAVLEGHAPAVRQDVAIQIGLPTSPDYAASRRLD